ncbi:MAG: capsule biosynthesis protein CapA [Pseudomonadota bacterium]
MDRHFVFLQGPHGPFFAQLARRLSVLGAAATRVGFNMGDRLFWPRSLPYHAYTGPLSDWAKAFEAILDQTAASDLVIYGDTRAIHAQAIAAARARGLRLHVFEEGYLRPYWVTYERDGANGHSRLMGLSEADIDDALGPSDAPLSNPPASWGAMRAHILYGAIYHFCGLMLSRRYRALAPHRDMPLRAEARLYAWHLILMPVHWLGRVLATARVMRGGFAYHLVLLQLAHDANFRDHGPFAGQGEFLEAVLAGFVRGAPKHHHLVVKTHPLEDGRFPLRRDLAERSARLGLSGRVHLIHGGKLARLLDSARSAVTVTSTAAHQALWRGLPVKAFGRAIYARPGITSDQELAGFFADPEAPDRVRYQRLRQYLLATSQIPGSFYSIAGRRQLMRQILDAMLPETDPYDRLNRGKTATIHTLFATPKTGL